MKRLSKKGKHAFPNNNNCQGADMVSSSKPSFKEDKIIVNVVRVHINLKTMGFGRKKLDAFITTIKNVFQKL